MRLEHARRKDCANGSVRRYDFKRKLDAINVLRSGTQRREPVFVEAVPKPCACVQDASAALNLAH